MKHTQGEWELRGNKIFVKGTNNSIAQIHVQSNYEPITFKPKKDVEAIANAKLLLAAPEMLDAMQLFVDRVDAGEVRSTKTYNSFKAIIKKATE